MNTNLARCCATLALSLALAAAPFASRAQGAGAAPVVGPTVLVLYDAVATSPYARLGLVHAIMLRNLLGHFSASVTLEDVATYKAGQIGSFQATFYVGSYYGNPLPAAFLADAATTQGTLVWINYNLWQLAWNPAYNFPAVRGFSFSGVSGMDAAPTAAVPDPGFFDTVSYGTAPPMVKYYAFDAASNTIASDPDVGLTAIVDATRAQAVATITDSHTGIQAPYVVRAGKFWYVADMPFEYIGPRDRYLVLCDVLHDMLGVVHATNHRALVRFEDLSALTSLSAMQALADYVSARKIPFSMAAIPLYQDPLGYYNGGVAQTITLAQSSSLRSILTYGLQRGGHVVMHGYTHQYDAVRNRFTGVSGDDFEFWNAATNAPVTEDSATWAGGRMDAGIRALKAYKYAPFAWEAPHYQSSPQAMAAVPSRFRQVYGRVMYYTSATPTTLNSPTLVGHDFDAGQFFPYVIASDQYGQKVLPENLGNVEYDICSIDPNSCITYSAQDILLNARYALVVRDGFASFFFHPFWLEPDIGAVIGAGTGLTDFESIVTGITALGFIWADPTTL